VFSRKLIPDVPGSSKYVSVVRKMKSIVFFGVVIFGLITDSNGTGKRFSNPLEKKEVHAGHISARTGETRREYPETIDIIEPEENGLPMTLDGPPKKSDVHPVTYIPMVGFAMGLLYLLWEGAQPDFKEKNMPKSNGTATGDKQSAAVGFGNNGPNYGKPIMEFEDFGNGDWETDNGSPSQHDFGDWRKRSGLAKNQRRSNLRRGRKLI